MQHRQRQGALQHLAQRGFITLQRQLQVARVKAQAAAGGAKLHRPRKQHRIGVVVGGPCEGEERLLQRNARVDEPTRQAVDVAQHRDRAELGKRPQGPVHLQAHCGAGPFRLQGEGYVLRQQAVVAAPALERHPQRGRADGGARQQPIAAPGQAAAEPAQRLVVQRLHGQAREALELPGRHAGGRVFHFLWRDLCLLQEGRCIHTGLRAGLHNRPHKGHGRGSGCRGRGWGQGGWQGGIGAGGHPRSVPQAWRDLQPRWHVKRGLQAYS